MSARYRAARCAGPKGEWARAEVRGCAPEPSVVKHYRVWTFPDALDEADARLAEFAEAYRNILGPQEAQRVAAAETLESLVAERGPGEDDDGGASRGSPRALPEHPPIEAESVISQSTRPEVMGF